LRDGEAVTQQLTTLQKNFETISDERKQFAQDIRDRKLRESQFNDEYNALEEENTCLQKSVSKLKHTVVEYEGLKVENKSLLDEVDSLQLQLHVTTSARDQFEKQLHEALESVKEQRERHAQYQKEIHDLKQQTILKTWNMEIKDFSENPIIKQITEELKDTQPVPASGLVDDLLKELQFTEMKELEEQLRVVSKEKQDLAQQLSIQNDVGQKDEKQPDGDFSEYADKIKELTSREAMYQMEITRLTHTIDESKALCKDLEKEKNALTEECKNEKSKNSSLVLSLKSKLRESQSSLKNLEADVVMLREVSGESKKSLSSIFEDLKIFHVELLRLNGQMSADNGVKSYPISTSNKSPGRGFPGECFKVMTQVKEQMKILQITLSKVFSERSSNADAEHFSDQAKENLQLKEQLLKLQSLVATKREQISTLRTVLKANKSTYEVALANLKSRYENDKDIQSETNAQLKRQIKALKSECLTFTSMRSMFAARCDEYMKQLIEKEQVIKAAEEEKRTLNNLLKTAIQQKIAVKQKLEEFEIARERLRQFTKKNIKPPGKDGSKIKTPTKPVTRV